MLRRKEAFKATARRMREREEAFGPHQRYRARAAAQPLPACCATAARPPPPREEGGREEEEGSYGAPLATGAVAITLTCRLRRRLAPRRRHLREREGGREEEREKEGGRSAPLVPNAVVVAPGGGVGRREEAKRGATGGRPRFFSWRRQSGRFSWRRLSGRHGRFVSTVGIKLRWTNGRRR